MTTVDPRYPSQLHALWTTLDKEITWLHGRWIIYRQLFGTWNKWVAHFDRSTMLNEDVIPRMGPSRQEIESALEALREAMNCVSGYYTDTTIAYEHLSMQADGEALLQCLGKGLRYRELVEAGTVPRDDYRKRFNGEV